MVRAVPGREAQDRLDGVPAARAQEDLMPDEIIRCKDFAHCEKSSFVNCPCGCREPDIFARRACREKSLS